jgi:hypothetical protein
MESPEPGENPGAAFAAAAAAYALEHEGLYRLLWLEALPGPPPEEALAAVARHSGAYARRIAALAEAAGTAVPGERAAGFLMAYTLGEISALLAGRIFASPDRAAAELAAGAGALWELIAAGRTPAAAR